MAELVVIGYSNEAEAREVCGVVCGLERDLVIQTAGSAVVVRDDAGALRVISHNPAAATAGGESPWATIFDLFGDQVATIVRPGSAAVAMLFMGATPDRTVEALAPYGGTLLKASFSGDAERRVQSAMGVSSMATSP